MNLELAYELLLATTQQPHGFLKIADPDLEQDVREIAQAGLVTATLSDGKEGSFTAINSVTDTGMSFLANQRILKQLQRGRTFCDYSHVWQNMSRRPNPGVQAPAGEIEIIISTPASPYLCASTRELLRNQLANFLIRHGMTVKAKQISFVEVKDRKIGLALEASPSLCRLALEMYLCQSNALISNGAQFREELRKWSERDSEDVDSPNILKFVPNGDVQPTDLLQGHA